MTVFFNETYTQKGSFGLITRRRCSLMRQVYGMVTILPQWRQNCLLLFCILIYMSMFEKKIQTSMSRVLNESAYKISYSLCKKIYKEVLILTSYYTYRLLIGNLPQHKHIFGKNFKINNSRVQYIL